MKTTFYKKLVPLAMIASLAVSGAGALSAQTGLADLISANAIVAYAEEASGFTFAVTSGTAAFTYDTLADDDAEASATVTITATKPAGEEGEPAPAVTEADLDAGKLSVKKGDKAVADVKFDLKANATTGFDVTMTAAKKIADANKGSLDLFYGAEKVGAVTVSSATANAAGDDAKGTHVEGAKLTKYDGDSTEIDLGKVNGITAIGADAFKDSAITAVKLAAGITAIEGNAFAGCSKLTTIEIPNGLASITLGTAATAEADAVKAFGEEPNQYLTAVGTNVDPAVKAAFEAEGVEVLDLANLNTADNVVIAQAGEVLKLISKNGAVIGSDGTAKVAISSPDSPYYEGTFDFASIENPTWELINPSTKKPASAAKFGEGKKFTKTKASGETLLIGGTKANGKFNNSVILSAGVQQPRVDENGILVTGKIAETKDGKTTYADNKDKDGNIVYSQIKTTFDATAKAAAYIGSEATMTPESYTALLKAVDELKAAKEAADTAKTAAETAQKDAKTAYDAKMTEIYGGTEYSATPASGLKATAMADEDASGIAQTTLINALTAINNEATTGTAVDTSKNKLYSLTEDAIDAAEQKASSGMDETTFNNLKKPAKDALAAYKSAVDAAEASDAALTKAYKELTGATAIASADAIKDATDGLAGTLNAANTDLTAKTNAAKTATDNYDALDAIKTAVEAQKSDIKVSAEVKIYIAPAAPTEWNAKSTAAKTSKGVSFAPVAEDAAEKVADYTLEIEEGKTFTIPLKLKDGADKTLNYNTVSDEDGNIVNNASVTAKGKVKAITPNCELDAEGKIVNAKPQIIAVEPAEGVMDAVTVAVYVKPATTKTYTNTKSVIITGGEAAELTLGTVPPSEKAVSYTVNVPEGYTASYTDANGVNGNVTSDTAFKATGAVKLSVKDADGKEIAKSADLKVKADNAKEVVVKLKGADAYQNVKSFKETGKKDKTTGYRVVNMVAGSSYNLGLSVSPVTADSKYELKTLTEMNIGKGKVSIDGDAVTVDAPGTYYVQATSNGIGEKSEKVESSIFEINVYAPTESLIVAGGYTVKGGYLMAAKNADTDCKKEFAPGQWISPQLNIPGNEPIEWKSNKPGVVPVTTSAGNVFIGLFGSGTFTITGTTQYTKQKYTFKVAVDKWTDSKLKPEASDITAEKNCIIATSGVEDGVMLLNGKGQLALDLAAGKSAAADPDAEAAAQANALSGLAAKTVKFTSSDKNIVNVTNAGAITAKGVGTATITATITGDKVKGGTAPEFVTAKFTIKVEAKPTVSNVKVAATALKATDFKVSAKIANGEKGKALKWVVAPKAGFDPETATASGAKEATNNKLQIAAAGEYMVYPCYDTIPYADQAQLITVTNAAPVSVTIDNDAKQFAKGFLNADKTTTAVATVSVAGKKDDTTSFDVADIDWVSSNANVAWVESSTKGTSNASYATVKIGMDPTKATPERGTKVTLTGTLRNGGKKVKITVNVGKENAPTPTDAPKATDATDTSK